MTGAAGAGRGASDRLTGAAGAGRGASDRMTGAAGAGLGADGELGAGADQVGAGDAWGRLESIRVPDDGLEGRLPGVVSGGATGAVRVAEPGVPGRAAGTWLA